MSLVFAGVEVAGGSTVGLKDHVTIPVYLQQHGDNNNDHKGEEEKGKRKERNGFFIEEKVVEEESSETSSIGVQSSDSSSEQDEVQSKTKNGAFGSLDSLEESLPIKRGLSNFFSGKSKSFASLADVAAATARDLVKPENPFNKRRRLLMASRTRRASYASFMTCLPPLSPDHIAEEEEDEDERNGGDSTTLAPLPPHVSKERKIRKAFRSPRSFSLSDLQNV
ncbi:glucosidase 2 subunit beta [Cocos nucifera]|uniref:Glucosidase 2 subunit beta n=1 Tax=Cocos nucifera TaxID=13894 RepID=A0A8K0IQF6_COCNU|nr:glucosidase 2 subunit beta [Cocos nucifera]